MKTVSILIPAYNEEGSIKPLLEEITSQKKLQIYGLEIIVVDDGSSDKTYINAKNFVKNFARKKRVTFQIIRLLRNVGKTPAINAGIEYMTGDYLVLMDADLQDDPKYICEFIKKIEKENIDLVVGNRSNRYKGNRLKYLSSHFANWVMRHTTGDIYHDMNCGFKVMTSEVAYSLGLKKGYHRYIPLIASMRGFSGGEIIIKQRKREYGESKYGKTGLVRLVRSMLDMISIVFVYKFREKPFDIFGRAGFVLFAVGFGILVYLSVGWVFGRYILGRPLFFFGILLVLIGINVISLGLLGELVSDRGSATKSYIVKKKYTNE